MTPSAPANGQRGPGRPREQAAEAAITAAGRMPRCSPTSWSARCCTARWRPARPDGAFVDALIALLADVAYARLLPTRRGATNPLTS